MFYKLFEIIKHYKLNTGSIEYVNVLILSTHDFN